MWFHCYNCLLYMAMALSSCLFRQAWRKLGVMPTEEAMEKYIEIVTQLYPTWLHGGLVLTFFLLLFFFIFIQFFVFISEMFVWSSLLALLWRTRKLEVEMMQSQAQEEPWGLFLALWFMKRNPKMSCKVLLMSFLLSLLWLLSVLIRWYMWNPKIH